MPLLIVTSLCYEKCPSEVLTSFHKRREFNIVVKLSRVWRRQYLRYSIWRRPCKFIDLRTVLEFYLVENTFTFGINLLVVLPTTLHSVWFQATHPLKHYPINTLLLEIIRQKPLYFHRQHQTNYSPPSHDVQLALMGVWCIFIVFINKFSLYRGDWSKQ